MSLARRPHEIVLWDDSIGSSHVRTDAQTKMKSDLCMFLHHALHWAVYEMSQFMRLWYLSHMQPAKAQTSLHIRTVLPGGGPNPPLDLHVESPDATVCLQNHGLSKFK